MSRIRVLIADDHRDFRRVIHEFLDRLPNVSVIGEAVNGNDAIEKVGDLIPDVVLMDISMPLLNGLDATKIIKQRWPATKVIVATSNDEPIYRTKAFEAKADAFISKGLLVPSLEEAFSDQQAPQYFLNRE